MESLPNVWLEITLVKTMQSAWLHEFLWLWAAARHRRMLGHPRLGLAGQRWEEWVGVTQLVEHRI